MGVTDEQLLSLGSYQTSAAFDELERAALDLAVAMAAAPAEIPDELVARLREHLDERQLIELAAAIAWENYRARFDRVFRIQSSGFSAGAVCALPEKSSA